MNWNHQPHGTWTVGLKNSTKLSITWRNWYWRMDLFSAGISFHAMAEFHDLGVHQIKEVQHRALVNAAKVLGEAGRRCWESQLEAADLLIKSFTEEETTNEKMGSSPA